jgi:hypothetical protein
MNSGLFDRRSVEVAAGSVPVALVIGAYPCWKCFGEVRVVTRAL